MTPFHPEKMTLTEAWSAVESLLPTGWGVGIEPQQDGSYRVGVSGATTWDIEAHGTTLAIALGYLVLPLRKLGRSSEAGDPASSA